MKSLHQNRKAQWSWSRNWSEGRRAQACPGGPRTTSDLCALVRTVPSGSLGTHGSARQTSQWHEGRTRGRGLRAWVCRGLHAGLHAPLRAQFTGGKRVRSLI